MIQKLIVLAAVIAIVWYGFKFITRIDKERREKLAQEKSDAKSSIADTVQCPVCKTYMAANGAANCGKSDCPY